MICQADLSLDRLGEQDGKWEAPFPDSADDAEDLTAENSELQLCVGELCQQLKQVETIQAQQLAQEQDYQQLIQGKAEVIAELQGKLQGTRRETAAGPASAVPTEDQLLTLHQENEEQREQLKRDRETLLAQFRDTEVQMARDRAELARERNDWQCMHNQLERLLHIETKYGVIRDKLASLGQLQRELVTRYGGRRSRSKVGIRVGVPSQDGFLKRLFRHWFASG